MIRPFRTDAGRLARTLFALATFAIGVFLFPIDSDVALASDGVWYGLELEADPARSIVGNHPMFHLVAWPILRVIAALEIPNPGLVAVRIVSAIGGAVMVWLVAAFAGRHASWFGMAAAAYLFSSRTFLIESCTGESIPSATAAALGVTYVALHHRRRRWLVGALLALALTLRQDNVFLVPGITLAVIPRGAGRLKKALVFLAAAGICVLGVYLVAWKIAAPEADFTRFALGLGAGGAWYVQPEIQAHPAILELGAIAVALLGRHWPESSHQPLLGVAALLLQVVVSLTKRGVGRMTCEAWLFGLPVALRLLFYGWFEAPNPEWQLFSIAFSCACASRLAKLSQPMGFYRTRSLLLGAIAGAIMLSHGPFTLALRQTVSRDAFREALRVAPPDSVVVGEGPGAPPMLRLMGVNATRLLGSPSEVLTRLSSVVVANPGRPVLAITDRFVLDAMPHTAHHLSEHRPELDRYVESDRVKLIRRGGLVYAMLILPE